jgi:glycosyltransferase involved in cell wall biosynthesis
MSFLVFCSFEVGGIPFRMVEILNRFKVETYYIYLGNKTAGHDSTQFHYGDASCSWDLSNLFQDILNDTPKIIQTLKETKEKYNICHCLAIGIDAYLLKKANISYKYWAYGSDLDQYCFIRTSLSNPFLRKRFLIHPLRIYHERQRARKSIQRSDSVMIAPYQFKALMKVSLNKEMYFLPHPLSIFEFSELQKQKRKNRESICKEIEAEEYFFSSTRHVWAGSSKKMSDNKGNDVMLHTFAKYIRLSKNRHSKLVLVKKGQDVEHSRSLACSLGINNSVEWLEEMKREELNKYYQGASICFGQFGTSVINFSLLESLANASICVSYYNETNSPVPYYKTIPPIFNSREPELIAEFMIRALENEEIWNGLSYDSWNWVKENCSEQRFVESFLSLFKEA